MKRLGLIPSELRRIADAKLGRCASCMRGAAWGMVAGWGVTAILVVFWPNGVAIGIAAVAAIGLTLLLGTHLALLAARTARRVQAREADAGAAFDRRRFLGTAVAAAAGAALVALGFPGRAEARTKCNGAHNAGNQPADFPRNVTGSGATVAAARMEMLTDADANCQAYCAPKTCPPQHRCFSSRRPTINDINSTVPDKNGNFTKPWNAADDCTTAGGVVTCNGKLTKCNCHCA